MANQTDLRSVFCNRDFTKTCNLEKRKINKSFFQFSYSQFCFSKCYCTFSSFFSRYFFLLFTFFFLIKQLKTSLLLALREFNHYPGILQMEYEIFPEIPSECILCMVSWEHSRFLISSKMHPASVWCMLDTWSLRCLPNHLLLNSHSSFFT